MAAAEKDTGAAAPARVSERPYVPPPKDLTFYIVLLVVIIPLWSIPPLSWGFVLYSLRTDSLWTFAWLGKFIFALALAEVFFSVYHFNLAGYVAGPCRVGAGNLGELQTAFKRVLQAGLASLSEEGYDEETLDDERPGSPGEEIELLESTDPRAIDFRTMLRTWFGRVPFSQIRRQEMFEWFYWAIFNAKLPALDTLPASHRTVLEDTLKMVEMRTGVQIPEGSNPAARPLRLTLDPVTIAWRPFGFYVFITVANYLARLRLRHKWQVKHYSKHGLDYLLRIPEGYDVKTGPQPIVFMHGLGLGLLQYMPIISYLMKVLPDTPFLVPLQPHISQQIFHPHFLMPKGRKETAEAMRTILEELGWAEAGESDDVPIQARAKGVTVISHSNGSYSHAWVLKAYPQLIKRSCFVDPVTFCLWEGDVCYNFLYRRCHNGLQLVMRYFVGMELGVANLLQRNFDWSSNSLWYEEIPNARDPSRTKFFLGGSDSILHADRVKRYLTSHGVRNGLWYDPNGQHGQALRGEGVKELVRWIQEGAVEKP
ncbi:hypothetical protein EVG20_g5999 [Dentipellis fragilis]|uniref:AB hydrolase-1 domain-containing protein n=1 Tax=Dentipellis fragilis TaxID=205917 RepID=A0A4Y9YT59_9AGAM|nr:hypothetical protein EVG20_g5999 [Dentipellis fragilis]